MMVLKLFKDRIITDMQFDLRTSWQMVQQSRSAATEKSALHGQINCINMGQVCILSYFQLSHAGMKYLQWWKVTKCIYSSTVLSSTVLSGTFKLYLSIFNPYFILPFYYIWKANIALFTSLWARLQIDVINTKHN